MAVKITGAGCESGNIVDLPEWVWRVVEAVQEYDEVHPTLYMERTGGTYEQYPCLDEPLEKIIPELVWQAAQVMRSRAAGGGS